MKKDYLPMAWGFWGIAAPLLLFGFLFGRSSSERITVFLGAGIFILIGYFISRAEQ